MRDACLPGHPNSLDFMQFSGKFGKIVSWHPLGSWCPLFGKSCTCLCFLGLMPPIFTPLGVGTCSFSLAPTLRPTRSPLTSFGLLGTSDQGGSPQIHTEGCQSFFLNTPSLQYYSVELISKCKLSYPYTMFGGISLVLFSGLVSMNQLLRDLPMV